MRFRWKTTLVLLVLIGLVAGGVTFVRGYLKNIGKPKYRTDKVTRGPIVSVVNATGTVKPVLSISVGAFVSGPIEGLSVDFNDVVYDGQVLATIDPRIYLAAVARDQAQLATREAELVRAQHLHKQAERDEQRALALQMENKDFISIAELDKVRFNKLALAAQVLVAEALVDQAIANLNNSKANLDYTIIRAPVNGIILDRKIDQGQTLASSFQTPELFIVAPDLKTMHIHATVDEADIGFIIKAKQARLPVRFTVDAHSDDLFTGRILQIRKSSTTTQNVVTYPVIVETRNPEIVKAPTLMKEEQQRADLDVASRLAISLGNGPIVSALAWAHPVTTNVIPEFKLMPGMTASLSFQVDDAKEVLRIPNAALRYYPERERVRPDDHGILDGIERETQQQEDTTQVELTAKQKADKRRNRNRRHVWVREGELLRAIEVVTGLSDNRYTEVISGELVDGQELVTGVKTK